MKKAIKNLKLKFKDEDLSPLEILLAFGTFFIFVMAFLVFIAPTIITFIIIPPNTIPELGTIVKFKGYTIGILPAIDKGQNLIMVGVGFFMIILYKIMRKTRSFCLNVLWDYFQILFWLAQTIYFMFEGPFLLRAGFCGLFAGSAIYIVMDLVKEKRHDILARLKE
jgi:hypothetical protein